MDQTFSPRTEDKMANVRKVVVSGFFDPIHQGHIFYLRDAKQHGDYLIAILNTDEEAIQKKGYVFQIYEEREAILESIKYVDLVIKNFLNSYGTVSESLREIYETFGKFIFCKGGDRVESNMPESELNFCKQAGIPIIYNVGGGKIQSSSELVKSHRIHEYLFGRRE